MQTPSTSCAIRWPLEQVHDRIHNRIHNVSFLCDNNKNDSHYRYHLAQIATKPSQPTTVRKEKNESQQFAHQEH